MKRLQKLIAALSAIVVIAILVAGLVAPMVSPKEPDIIMTAFAPGERPEGEKLDLIMPDAENETAVKEFVAELYAIAAEKYCTAPNVAYQTTYSNTMMGVPVTGQRYNVRNGDKNYYTEYSFIEGDTGILGAIVGMAGGDNTRFAEARYTDGSMDYTSSYKMAVKSESNAPTYVMDENGNRIYDVVWDLAVAKELEKHDYGYRLTDHDITVDTILEASVEYNEEEGYYTLNLKLDLEKAPALITLPNLKASSGMADAHYTVLDQKIEIWDNGYPRYFHAFDIWEGTMVIHMSSELDFRTTYYFDDYWTDISNYQYMEEYCKAR